MPKKREKSRWEQHVATTGEAPQMPEIEEGGQVIEYLQEVGPTIPGPMGPEPVTFGEIAAWTEATGHELSGWEAKAVKHLSRAFVNQHANSKEVNTPAPWQGDQIDRQSVAKGIDRLLGMASRKASKK